MSDINELIIKHVKKAKTMYNNGDYTGCVAECRHILEKKTFNVDVKKDEKDGQQMRFKKAFSLIKNLTPLAHHVSDKDPKHDFTRLEARCILATSIAFSEMIIQGYFDIETDECDN